MARRSRPCRATTAVALALAAASALAALAGAGKSAAVPYPEGYREWTHLESMAIVSKEHPLFSSFGGIQHVYVNRRGLEAARNGGGYPDGSVLVFDLLAAESADGAHAEGARKFIGVMVKDARAHGATGGWALEAFKGDAKDRRVVRDATSQCFACHQSRQESDFVFSTYRR
jgi:hypothetical protein